MAIPNKMLMMTDSGSSNGNKKTTTKTTVTKQPSSAKLEQVKKNVANQTTAKQNTTTNSVTNNVTNKNSSVSNNNTPTVTVTPKASSAISGVDQGTLDTINSQFTASAKYQEAMDYTNSLLQQLSSGRTSYTDQINSLMTQIQNRDPFEYDVDSDVLFQQSLASAMGSGKTAMQDTIGQASALTGGYGSTYATSAGNQAYNQFIEEAYNNLPEYYQMAMEAYQMEGQEMYDQFAMLSAADEQEYQRMQNAWSANFQNANNMYAQEYQQWADEVANAMSYAGMANSDYWNRADYNESVRQFNETLARNQSKFDQQMAYNYASLAQEQSQFEASQASKSANATNATPAYKEPSETQMKRALEAYNTGGEEALYQYVDSLGSDIDMEAIDFYVNQYGQLPLEQRTFTKAEDTFNWLGGNDRNDVVTDQYGNSYRISELPEGIRKALTKLKKGESYTVQ